MGKSVTVFLPDDLVKTLDDIASQLDLSRTSIIKMILEAFCSGDEKKIADFFVVEEEGEEEEEEEEEEESEEEEEE